MTPFSPITPRHPIRVVLSSTALLPFMSVRKAAALAIAQLGVAAFFIAGVARAALGESAAWFVLAGDGPRGVRPRHRHRELGAARFPADSSAGSRARSAHAPSRPAKAHRAGRASSARRARLCRRRPLRRQRRRRRPSPDGASPVRPARGSRDRRGRRRRSECCGSPTRIGRDIGRETMARASGLASAFCVRHDVWGVSRSCVDGAAVVDRRVASAAVASSPDGGRSTRRLTFLARLCA